MRHQFYDIGPDCEVTVHCSHHANVMMMSAADFRSFNAGGRYTYWGGWYTRSPIIFRPPGYGRWVFVVWRSGRSADTSRDNISFSYEQDLVAYPSSGGGTNAGSNPTFYGVGRNGIGSGQVGRWATGNNITGTGNRP